MEVYTKRKDTIVSGALASKKVGISQSMMDQMSRYFRDQIYTNKPLAAIRETVCNAVDEHIKHNVTRKVRITLPSVEYPFFEVRDYGLGLSKDNVFDIFFQYGESTKNKDRLAIGGFGIGAKAPFAYVDQFFVTSWFEGKKGVYLGVDEGQDCTVNEVESEDSDEPSGIEVKFEVGLDKIRTFKAEFMNFYAYFSTFAELDIYLNGENVTPEPAELWKSVKESGVQASSNHYYDHRVLHKGVTYDYSACKPNYPRGFLVYIPDNVRLDIQRSREALEGTDHNRAIIQEIIKQYADKRLAALEKIWPKEGTDPFDVWDFASKPEIVSEISFLKSFGCTRQSMHPSFSIRIYDFSVLLSQPDIFTNRWMVWNSGTWTEEEILEKRNQPYLATYESIVIGKNTKLLFGPRRSLTPGYILALNQKFGNSWYYFSKPKKIIEEKDPTTKALVRKEEVFTFEDFKKLFHANQYFPIDVSRLCLDASDVKPVKITRPKEEKSKAFLERTCVYCFGEQRFCNASSMNDLFKKKEEEGETIFFVRAKNFKPIFNEREKRELESLNAISFLSKKINHIIVVNKNREKDIPENWQDVMPIIKAMRRNAHKILQNASSLKLSARDKKFLEYLELDKYVKITWPFAPNLAKLKNKKDKISEIIEKHKKLKKTDMYYATMWAVLDGNEYNGLDFEMKKDDLLLEIKNKLK